MLYHSMPVCSEDLLTIFLPKMQLTFLSIIPLGLGQTHHVMIVVFSH